jgi:hypothetical protein
MRSILTDAHQLCAAKFPGQPWRYPKYEGVPFWHGAICLLSLLVVMHAYWFYLFFKIAIKALTTNETDKGKIYETDLDEGKKKALEEKKSE